MSRISRYQDSIDKFIQTKSSLLTISEHNRPHLDLMYGDFDHLIAICLITILNTKRKKAKLKFHGYYIASGIDVALAMAMLTDKTDFFKEEMGESGMAQFIPELVAIMYQCLSGNIDSLKLNVSAEETLRINQYCINYMSNKMGDLTFIKDYSTKERIKKSDFVDYKFSKPEHRTKYKKFRRVSDEDLFSMIDKKYGAVCKMSLIFGWLLGLGEEKEIKELENMGKHMGIIFKIGYDFASIEQDLETCKGYTYNVVINKGIKESVDIFLDSKAELIKGILKLGIWKPTIKEILDLVEQNIDDALDNTDIDEKFEFSEFSSTEAFTDTSHKSKNRDSKTGKKIEAAISKKRSSNTKKITGDGTVKTVKKVE